ncbi:MAG: hypothetical protein HY235_09980 [Acidobacteria bacterium]|nr:hypothetical protein [Acidobacteriota bacterium]
MYRSVMYVVSAGVAAAALLPAQQRGVYGAPPAGAQRGMYGGVSTGQMVGSINDPGFASRLGATISGLPQTTTRIPVQRGVYGMPITTSGHQWHPRASRTMVVPWGLPVYYGGYYDGGYATSIVQPVQAVQPAPSVIINQYYSPEVVRPEMKEYTDLPQPIRPPEPAPPRSKVAPPESGKVTEKKAEEARAEAERPTITLLAFKDSSVAAVIAYWTEKEQLHYVTRNFSKRIVPTASLDLELTAQLNHERNVEFKLEPVR